MSKTAAAASPRWFAGWRTGTDRIPHDDPADLGTAFGLDMSLEEEADAGAATEAAAAAARAPSWVQRLGVRRKRAA